MARTYRGAVVGYGNLGATHAEVMSGLEPIRVVAVADQVAEARARAEQDLPGVTLYEDAGEMFRKENLDIVAIATHASGHAALSLLASAHRNQAADTVGRQIRTRCRIQEDAQPASSATGMALADARMNAVTLLARRPRPAMR